MIAITMRIEAVRQDAEPASAELVQDFMRIQCRQCTVTYCLCHDGVGLKQLRDYFLRASWQISGEHPNHSRIIELEAQSLARGKRAS